jgi:hypothetical protein
MSTGMMGKVEARDDPGSRPNRPGHQGIQEAEQAHIGVIRAAMHFTDGDIDSPGMTCFETRREWIWMRHRKS